MIRPAARIWHRRPALQAQCRRLSGTSATYMPIRLPGSTSVNVLIDYLVQDGACDGECHQQGPRRKVFHQERTDDSHAEDCHRHDVITLRKHLCGLFIHMPVWVKTALYARCWTFIIQRGTRGVDMTKPLAFGVLFIVAISLMPLASSAFDENTHENALMTFAIINLTCFNREFQANRQRILINRPRVADVPDNLQLAPQQARVSSRLQVFLGGSIMPQMSTETKRPTIKRHHLPCRRVRFYRKPRSARGENGSQAPFRVPPACLWTWLRADRSFSAPSSAICSPSSILYSPEKEFEQLLPKQATCSEFWSWMGFLVTIVWYLSAVPYVHRMLAFVHHSV